MTTSSVSIIIPALNEEAGIEKTIKAIPKAGLEAIGYTVQILAVDNGSSDRTAELAARAGAEVIFEAKRGYGHAYKAGFASTKGNIIVTTDADLSYPVEDIPRLVQMLGEQNLDFITTNRHAYMEKGAMSALHKLGNAALSLTMRLLFHIDLKDSQSGMWVFRKKLLDKMILRSGSMALSGELKIEACYYNKSRWVEAPIHYRTRVGKAKLRTWRDGFGNLFHLIRKRVVR